ncbi:MAG: tRNA (guanosine(37)-N1)-methyltransferase TrmD [Blautia sp.]|nr:tRNA (guanosine(37)-N1)-methyltransferase TrmD [Blautia sp.]
MRISVLTMCPEMFGDFQKTPLISRAMISGRLRFDVTDFRDFTKGSFRRIDDSPYGGGPGMVIRCQPVLDALQSLRDPQSHVVILSPAGTPFTQAKAHELAAREHLILVCGHYEGFDARIYEHGDEIISIGDYILTGGELPAMVVTDAVVRLLKGSLREGSASEESFEKGLLEYPQYTRPADYKGQKVPEVLLSGNHEAIRSWREEEARRLTRKYRPDLLRK